MKSRPSDPNVLLCERERVMNKHNIALVVAAIFMVVCIILQCRRIEALEKKSKTPVKNSSAAK